MQLSLERARQRPEKEMQLLSASTPVVLKCIGLERNGWEGSGDIAG